MHSKKLFSVGGAQNAYEDAMKEMLQEEKTNDILEEANIAETAFNEDVNTAITYLEEAENILKKYKSLKKSHEYVTKAVGEMINHDPTL